VDAELGEAGFEADSTTVASSAFAGALIDRRRSASVKTLEYYYWVIFLAEELIIGRLARGDRASIVDHGRSNLTVNLKSKQVVLDIHCPTAFLLRLPNSPRLCLSLLPAACCSSIIPQGPSSCVQNSPFVSGSVKTTLSTVACHSFLVVRCLLASSSRCSE
jgi:hypothetical protein